MAGVTLKDVRKIYAGGIEAIKGISFDVPTAPFCVLVGPSGCGKSTLLRMIAGHRDHQLGGEIRIGDRVVNDIEPSERDIAMVFQNYALYPHMIGLRQHGLRPAQPRQRRRPRSRRA